MTVAYVCSLDGCGVDSESGDEERKKCDWRELGKKLHRRRQLMKVTLLYVYVVGVESVVMKDAGGVRGREREGSSWGAERWLDGILREV